MKNILFIFVFLGSMQLYSQKSVEIFNYTDRTVRISSIFTKPLTADFPWCASVTPNYISINPGGSYILENSSDSYRFPFDSPNSSPLFTHWRRIVEPLIPGGDSNWSTIPSSAAWAGGSGQFFNYLQFTVFSDSVFNGGGYIGKPSFWVASNPISDFTYLWEAFYDGFTIGTTVIDTVVIFNT